LRVYRVAILAVVAAALAWTAQRIDWLAVEDEVWRARALPLLGAAALVVLPLAARSLRAARLLRRCGFHDIPLRRVAAVTVFGFSMSSLTPGGSGDLLRVAALRPYGVDAATAASIVVYERVLDVLAMALLLVVALAWTLLPVALAASVCALLGALVALLGLGFARWQPDPAALARHMPGFVRRRLPSGEVGRELLAPATLAQAGGWTALVFMSEALRPWLVLDSLDLGVGLLGAWAIFTLAWLAGLVSMLPMGVGSWETAAVWAFGLYGIYPSRGAAGALLLRAGVTLPALVAGLVSMGALRHALVGGRARVDRG